MGRPSFHQLHPNLVSCVKSFIEQSSAAAHLRRRDNVMYTNGVSLKDIVQHVKKTLGITVSKNTVHRLMQPPRRKTIASKRYLGLIPARVPPKRNSNEKKEHIDFHFTCSQVNLVNEMAVLCENTLSLSVDNKNKVEVGIPATSRRSKIRTFYMVSEAPNYNDHDFPHANSKLVPAGYQILRSKLKRAKSLSPKRKETFFSNRKRSLSVGESFGEQLRGKKELTKDKINRERVKWPRSGPLLVQLYPSRLIESTNVMHVNHLMQLIKREKQLKEVYNVVAIADGGPDWSVKGVINFLSLGYLWTNARLDTLIVQCYAPGHSRFNPIERSWSFLTNKIIGVILPDEIDGKVPQPGDSVAWMKVLDNATITCSKFWDKKVYAGYPISTETFLSDNPLIPAIKSTHQLLKDFANASTKKIKETPNFLKLQNDYTFLVKHANRKAYQLEFVRCKDGLCTHCSSLPSHENRFMELMDKFGGSCPTPKMHTFHKEHYQTFLEMLQSQFHVKSRKIVSNPTSFGVCTKGCSYAFFSKADRERHMRLMKH